MSCKCASFDEDEGRNETEEEICGNPYDDLWIGLKFKIESSDYCKSIREEDFSPAFYQALCDKCIEKKCEFINICLELKKLRKEK